MLWIRLTFVIQVIGQLLDGFSEVIELARDVCEENGIKEEDIGDGGGYEGDSDDEGEKGVCPYRDQEYGRIDHLIRYI
jgi:hypothetical protein